LQLIVARVKEFTQQPEAIFWSYAFPVLMVLALGVAFRNKPATQIAVDVVHGEYAARVLQQLALDPMFVVRVSSPDQARLRLRTARADLVILADPASVATSHREPPLASETDQHAPLLRYLYDPTRPESALARLHVDDALQRAAGRKDTVRVDDQPVVEPGSRYVDFLVPGLLGMNIMAGGLWGVGFAIVYMRIRKLLKRLVATPMKKSHFLTGVIISRLLFLIPGVLVILLFSWRIGLLVASRASTIEMVSGLMNLVMLPMWVFSGVFFSSERFPGFLQPLIKALPLTPLIDGLRATMLEGSPLTTTDQLARLAWLLAWGAITFGLALRWFRWN
jgi:hypothetical protein